ncbi:MAG TPA: ATP-grasp domain-containing protein [Acidobacteriota bacterium]|nr:ATP-grasp domain-containing protein [Acidobacteriota bacterium]
MNVIFVEPAFPNNQRQFVRGLREAGANVIGIGERPAEYLDDQLRHWLYRYEQVPSVVHEGALMAAVKRCQSREWIDRMECTVEAHTLPTAKVREACTIPGTSVRTAFLCRDKPAMKEALREAGVPCAQSIGTNDPQEARQFAAKVGYPVIIKPRDSAGAAGTVKVHNDEEMDAAIHSSGISRGFQAALEEFVDGHEGFLDTLTIKGQVVHEFACHYYPNVLEAMRTRWISPQIITTNRIDAEGYKEVRRMARTVIKALGIDTSATHMEWFFGSKGLKFSEIGCRPPGVGAWDLYCAANEFDLYKEWGGAVVHRRPSQQLSRRFSAGMIALRPECDGIISGYSGTDYLESINEWIIDAHLPSPGTPTQPVEAGYMANAWVRVRHPDFDHLRGMLNTIGQRVRVHAR